LCARRAHPVSRFTVGLAPFGTINSGSLAQERRVRARPVPAIATRTQCYDLSMLDDLDQLAAKVGDLARLVHSLRTENQQLRTQLATAAGDLDAMRGRVDEASRRLDMLMERLPIAQSTAKVPWNT
jgi:hypothetical protein